MNFKEFNEELKGDNYTPDEEVNHFVVAVETPIEVGAHTMREYFHVREVRWDFRTERMIIVASEETVE